MEGSLIKSQIYLQHIVLIDLKYFRVFSEPTTCNRKSKLTSLLVSLIK